MEAVWVVDSLRAPVLHCWQALRRIKTEMIVTLQQQQQQQQLRYKDWTYWRSCRSWAWRHHRNSEGFLSTRTIICRGGNGRWWPAAGRRRAALLSVQPNHLTPSSVGDDLLWSIYHEMSTFSQSWYENGIVGALGARNGDAQRSSMSN